MPLTRRNFCGAAIAGGALAPLHARGQGLAPPPLPRGGPPVFPSQSPPLAGAGDGLAPGARITWLGASASIVGERYQLVPDEHGRWVNRATGQHYGPAESTSASGAAYLVADIQSPARGAFLMWSSNHLYNAEARATSLIDANGTFAPSQSPGDYWVNPAQLQAFGGDRNDGGMRVIHAPYPLNGRTYRAILIQNQVGDGWSQSTYDTDTGLLLSASSTAATSVMTPGYNGQAGVGAGNSLLTYNTLVSVRRTQLPGPGTTYPAAISRLRRIVYSGTNTTFIAGSDIQMPGTPVHFDYDITGQSPSFVEARLTIGGMPGMEAPTQRVIPAGVIGSLWMDPGFLERLGQGQVLDQDQATGVQAVVLGRQKDLAYLRLQTSISQQTFGYDLHSGLLLQAQTMRNLYPGILTTALRLDGTQ